MEQSDIILLLDKKYGHDTPCPNEGVPMKMQCGLTRSEHGSMAVHASGAYLVCGVCGTNQPTSRI